jgi:hypothetical protein
MEPFLRRDYESHQEVFVDLPAGIRTPVNLNLSQVQLVMLQVLDEDEAIVNIYRNLSPEYWQFSKVFAAWEIANCTSISLKSDVDVRVHVVAGGEA